METADQYSKRSFGTTTLAPFAPRSAAHRLAAAALRERLVAIGFDAERAAGDEAILPQDAAGRAARFFVLHEPQQPAELRSWLGEALVEFLLEMGTLVEDERGWRSIVSATWFGGCLIFADARAYNVIWPGDPPEDYVMPPGGDSAGLLRIAPDAPRRHTLDLCCGAGAQALAASAYSEQVTGIDLNPRALRFAGFNAALNGIGNVVFLRGDCYEPLGPARFDAIRANPPFVPWPKDEEVLLYRGGGDLGDEVVAKILAGAVDRLEPGGSLAIVADLANRAQLPERIRGWQGSARRTLILIQSSYDLATYAERHAAHIDDRAAREALVARLLAHYREHGIRTLDFGYILQDGEAGETRIATLSPAGELVPLKE